MSSWLDSVPVSDKAYAFQGALYCEDCGRDMCDSLRTQEVEDDYDSDTFPQGPYPDGGGESDSAQFCGRGQKCVNAVSVAEKKIGCPLRCPLTSDGVSAVVESVLANMFSRKKYSSMVGRLLRLAWAGSLPDVVLPQRVKPRYANDLPDSLIHQCKVHHSRHSVGSKEGFRDFVYADLDHAYLLYEHSGVVDLCRSAVDDEGNFQALEVVSMPVEVARGHDPGELFAEAVDESAWD